MPFSLLRLQSLFHGKPKPGRERLRSKSIVQDTAISLLMKQTSTALFHSSFSMHGFEVPLDDDPTLLDKSPHACLQAQDTRTFPNLLQ